MIKLRAVIFDMDGVLVDSEPFHHASEHIMFEELGIDVLNEEYSSFVGLSNDIMWRRLKESHGLSQTVEELLAGSRRKKLDYFRSVEGIEPVAGVRELLAEIKGAGLALAIASSSASDLIALLMERMGFADMFSVVVSGDDITHGKPAPDIYLRASELLGVSPAECVAIEDSRNGVLSAKGAGMVCVGFNNPFSLNQDLSAADLVVDDMQELTVAELHALVHGRAQGMS